MVVANVVGVAPASKKLWDVLDEEMASGRISHQRIKIQRFYFQLFWVEEKITPSDGSYNHTILGRYIRSFGVGDRVALGGGPG